MLSLLLFVVGVEVVLKEARGEAKQEKECELKYKDEKVPQAVPMSRRA